MDTKTLRENVEGLIEQATKERSHHYTAKVLRDCLSFIDAQSNPYIPSVAVMPPCSRTDLNIRLRKLHEKGIRVLSVQFSIGNEWILLCEDRGT